MSLGWKRRIITPLLVDANSHEEKQNPSTVKSSSYTSCNVPVSYTILINN